MKSAAQGGAKPLRSKKARIRSLKDNLISYSFLLPFIIGLGVFTAYPIIMSAYYAFSDFDGIHIYEFGLMNFKDIFDFSEFGIGIPFFKSLKVTFLYVIFGTGLSLVLSYILALFLRAKIPGIRFIRMLCYLPCLIPGIAAGIIWRDVFNYSPEDSLFNGLINTWITRFGGEPITFFSDASTALATLVLTGLWGLGGGMIMWIAAFENIPPELYEAATIDGAGYFKRLFKITLPMSTPILFYNAITSVIGGLQVFGTYATYGTGPDDSLNFVAIHIYRLAFDYNIGGRYGLACAMSWILFLIIGAITLVLFKTSGWIQYGEDA